MSYNFVSNYIQHIRPAFTGENILKEYDSIKKNLWSLKQEFNTADGHGQRLGELTDQELQAAAVDPKLSPAAREGAKYLLSPEGKTTLDRLRSHSGKHDDFNAKDLDQEVANRNRDAPYVKAHKQELADNELGVLSHRLEEAFKSAVDAAKITAVTPQISSTSIV